MCEQGGSWSPLGAAELYMEGSCCWRCVALTLTSLMILGHFPLFSHQQCKVLQILLGLGLDCFLILRTEAKGRNLLSSFLLLFIMAELGEHISQAAL